MTTRIWGKIVDDGTSTQQYRAEIYRDNTYCRGKSYFGTKLFAKIWLRKEVRRLAKATRRQRKEITEPYIYIINIPDKPQSRWQRWLNS